MSPSHKDSLQLHSLLSTSQHEISRGIHAYTLWDLCEHPIPSAQYVQQLGTSLGQATLAAPATNPPVDYLQITCDYPEPWDLIVTPSSMSSYTSPSHPGYLQLPMLPSPSSSPQSPRNGRFITVYDVLRAIYYDRQSLVSEAEFHNLPAKQQTRVSEAFDKRWRTSTNPEETRRGGLKKIDLLCKHTLFAGLSVDLDTPNTLILSLRRPT